MGTGVTLLLLGLVIGYLLRYRSVEAVEQLVSNLSKGQYKVTATSFRFNLFKFQVNAKNIRVAPTRDNNSNNLFEFRADSLSIQVNNPIQLLLFKRFSVNKLILRSPYLELKTLERDSTKQRQLRPLHIEIAAVQDVFFDVLSSLEVQQFRMSDGTVAIYPEISQHQRRFFLNHIYLNLDDLHLLRKIKQWDKTNRVAVDFKLLKPNIEYPDSTLQVVLDKLIWQSRDRKFELSGLDFLKQLEGQQEKSGFRLQNIELDSLNWDKLLTEGRIELGLLKAAKGYFTSNDIRFRTRKDEKSVQIENSFLDVLGTIKIKKIEIDSIEFKGSTISRRGNETLEIRGDNFNVTNLVVDNDLPNKVELEDLELKVRGFLESDSTKTFQTGFDGMRIKKNQLTLENYFLRAANRNKTVQTSISTSQLVLHNLSIPALLSGRLKADELFLINPGVRLHLSGKRSGKRGNPLRMVQRDIRRRLQIETIRIFDADLLIMEGDSKTPIVQSGAFSAIISSNSVLRAATLEEIFNGSNRLEMPTLALRLNQFNVDLTNVLYENNDLRADKATGTASQHQFRFNLKNIHIRDINAPGIIEQKDTNWIRLIEIGSGQLRLQSGLSNSGKKQAGSIPGNVLRTIRTGRIELIVEDPGFHFNTTLDTLAIDSLHKKDKDWKWDHYLIAGNQSSYRKDGLELRTAGYQLSSKGGDVKNIHLNTENNRMAINASVPGLHISGGIFNLNDPLGRITKTNLDHPVIHLTFKELSEFSETTSTNNRNNTIPALELIEPELHISKEMEGIKKQLFSNKGGQIKTASLQHSNGKISTSALELTLRNLVAIPEKTNLSIGNLHLKTKQFELDKTLHAAVDELLIRNAELDHHTEQYQLSIKSAELENKKMFSFSSKKEDLQHMLQNLPHINLAAREVVLVNKHRKWELFNPRADADKKLIGVDSIRSASLISRDSFFSKEPFQTDFIEFSAGKTRIVGFNREIEQKDTIWKANRLEMDQFKMNVDRDKRLPLDSISYRPMLPGLIQKLPLNIQLGAAILTRSRIQYNEISNKTGKEGAVWFNELNMVAGPITNYQIQPTDSLKITANSKFMDSGALKFGFQQSYVDSLYGFLLLARMGNMELNALSPLLMPLFNLHIKQGKTDSVWIRVKGNDYFAVGHMELDYSKLKIELLNEQGRKKKLTSFMANLLIRNRNGKKGMVYQERIRNKSTFNYWGKISLSGLMTNLGIKPDRKYIRKYKKQAKRLELPIELLD